MKPKTGKSSLRRIFMRHTSDKKKSFIPRRNRTDFSFNGGIGSTQGQAKLLRLRLKTIFLCIVLFCCSTSLLYILFFHPFFKIRHITITGIERIDEAEFKNVVYGVLDYKFLFVFPRESFFLLNLSELRDILQERFPLESIVIEKSFPSNIAITIEEKQSKLLYDNGEYYSYIDLNGQVVKILQKTSDDEWFEVSESVITSTVPVYTSFNTDSVTTGDSGENIVRHDTSSSAAVLGTHIVQIKKRVHKPRVDRILLEYGEDIPIIYDERHTPVAVNSQVLDKNFVQSIFDFNSLLAHNSDISVGYYIFESNYGYVTVVMREGWRLYLDLTQSIYTQFDMMQKALEQNSVTDRSSLEYINVRYKNKVFIK